MAIDASHETDLGQIIFLQYTMTRAVQSNLNITLDKVEDEIESKSEPPIVKGIPISKFDLSNVKGYSQKRASIKQQLLVNDSVAELKHALSIFDPAEIQLNHSLVLFVAQIVEDIFTKKGSGDVKRAVVVEVCKHYFNDSDELVNMVIDLIFDKVIKTSLFRRNKARFVNIFFWVLKQFGANCDMKFQTNFKTSLGR